MALLDEEEVREKISDKAADFVGLEIWKNTCQAGWKCTENCSWGSAGGSGKFGLKLLQREDIKERLLKLAQDVLEQKGMKWN